MQKFTRNERTPWIEAAATANVSVLVNPGFVADSDEASLDHRVRTDHAPVSDETIIDVDSRGLMDLHILSQPEQQITLMTNRLELTNMRKVVRRQ
jgi:hypothetical protein